MKYNNVQETTEITGTGDVTLTGPSQNGRAFQDVYATGSCFPYVIDDGAGNWESGIGRMTAPTVFERLYALDSSDGILPHDFAAGTKEVFVSNTAEMAGPGSNPIFDSQVVTGDKAVLSDSFTDNGAQTFTPSNNRQYFIHFKLSTYMEFNAVGVFCKSADTGSAQYNLGLYEDCGGVPSVLLASGTIDCTTTGTKEITPTAPFILQPGNYMLSLGKETGGDATFAGQNYLSATSQRMGVQTGSQYLFPVTMLYGAFTATMADYPTLVNGDVNQQVLKGFIR